MKRRTRTRLQCTRVSDPSIEPTCQLSSNIRARIDGLTLGITRRRRQSRTSNLPMLSITPGEGPMPPVQITQQTLTIETRGTYLTSRRSSRSTQYPLVTRITDLLREPSRQCPNDEGHERSGLKMIVSCHDPSCLSFTATSLQISGLVVVRMVRSCLTIDSHQVQTPTSQ